MDDDPGLLRTLIDTLPDRIYVKDNEARYVLNAAHVKKLGAVSSEEIARKTDFDTEEPAERITCLLVSASQVERNSTYR